MAEHILFDDEMVVSNAPGSPTYERTNEVVDHLWAIGAIEGDGGSLLSVRAFDLSNHARACETAARRISSLLGVSGTASELEARGAAMLEWQQQAGVKPVDIPGIIARHEEPMPLTELVKQRQDVPTAEAEYMIRSFRPLQKQLEVWTRQGGPTLNQAAAFTELTRIYLNEGLSREIGSLYAPAPHRVALADQANLLAGGGVRSPVLGNALYRHRVNDAAAQVLRAQGRPYVVPFFNELQCLDAFPLPLLALHLLHRRKIDSPRELLLEARRARDSSEARQMRAHLTDWEAKLAGGPEEVEQALAQISAVTKELEADLAPRTVKTTKKASIRWKIKLFPIPGIDVSLEGDRELPQSPALDSRVQQFELQRQFLASVARTVTMDRDFDAWLTTALQRALVPG